MRPSTGRGSAALLAALGMASCLGSAGAEGLVPAGSAPEALCFASGSDGARVPCVRDGPTWRRAGTRSEPGGAARPVAEATAEFGLAPEDFRRSGDGADWAPALNRALVAGAARGVPVRLRGRYPARTDVVLVENSTARCGMWPGGQRTSGNYAGVPCAILLDPAATIRGGQAAALERVAVLRDGMLPPDGTIRRLRDNLAAFAGTAITVTGHDFAVRDVIVAGFDRAYVAAGVQRPVLDGFYFDCNNGPSFDNVHDAGHVRTVHGWPFTTANLGGTETATVRVAGAADQGGNVWRVTTAVPHQVRTGDIVAVTGAGGAPGVNGRWPVVVVDGTHLDLVGSSVAKTFPAQTVAGQAQLRTTDLATLAVGQVVSGAGLPAGTTITGLWPSQGLVLLSAAATASARAVAITAAPGAYTTGGQVILGTFSRPGTALSITNSETTTVVDFFALGYQTCAYFGPGSQWSQVVAGNCDHDLGLGDGSTIGLWADGSARMNLWIGGSVSSVGEAVVNTTARPDEPGITVVGTSLNTVPNVRGQTVLRQDSGVVAITASHTALASRILFADGASALTLGGNTMPAVTTVFASEAPRARVLTDGVSEVVAYTPVLSATSGSLGAASALGHYRMDHGLVRIDQVRIDIRDTGSAGGTVQFTLPVPAGHERATLLGSEFVGAGRLIQARIAEGASAAAVFDANDGAVLANGLSLGLSGTYRPAP